MRQFKILGTALGAALLVAACGGGGDSVLLTGVAPLPAKGTLAANSPVPILAMTATTLTAKLANGTDASKGLLTIASNGSNTLPCGVDVRYMQYGTVGGAGEATDASGVIMLPTGGTACTSARPIVLYAHGTNISKNYNLADVANPNNPAAGESGLLMAMYAAQGFIVVAPNYAGYDTSRLGYHPYVNAAQQSQDMIDALTAAKSALPAGAASAKLFVTGYSQGGFVAMATVRAMQALPTPIPVTASAPMSGPYAMSAYTDFIFMGGVPLGSTAFAPMLTTSYKNSYPELNIYSNPSDIYESAYATGIESLIPGSYNFTTVYSAGKLPQTALFSNVTSDAPALGSVTPLVTGGPTDALFAMGVGTPNLIKNSARLSFVGDAMAHGFDGALPSAMTGSAQNFQLASGVANPLRRAAQRNDMRAGWTGPTSNMLLCGGNGDPTVFFDLNTKVMAGVWAAYRAAVPATYPMLMTVDVDDPRTTVGDGFDAVRAGFKQNRDAFSTAYGAVEATKAYHGTLVPPFCNAAARGFFSLF